MSAHSYLHKIDTVRWPRHTLVAPQFAVGIICGLVAKGSRVQAYNQIKAVVLSRYDVKRRG